MDELAESRSSGFALAFDRLEKSLAFNLNAYSSNCTSEVSCSWLFKFVTNLFKPWEILTMSEICLCLQIQCWFPLHIYLVSNWLWLPIRAQFCSLGSFSTIVRNPASKHNLLNLSCCENFSIRSPYSCKWRFLWTVSSQSEGFSLLITLGTNEEFDCPLTTGCPVLSGKVSYSSHISTTAP